MKLRVIALAAVAAVTLVGVSGCYVAPVRGGAYVDVAVAPPAPRVIVEPAVRPGFIWAPGYWRWDGRQHVWVDGRYMRERPGYHWRAARWDEHNGRYRFVEGHWER